MPAPPVWQPCGRLPQPWPAAEHLAWCRPVVLSEDHLPEVCVRASRCPDQPCQLLKDSSASPAAGIHPIRQRCRLRSPSPLRCPAPIAAAGKTSNCDANASAGGTLNSSRQLLCTAASGSQRCRTKSLKQTCDANASARGAMNTQMQVPLH